MTYFELRDLPRGTVVKSHDGLTGLVAEIHTGEYATNKVDRHIAWEHGGQSVNLEAIEGDMLDCESTVRLA